MKTGGKRGLVTVERNGKQVIQTHAGENVARAQEPVAEQPNANTANELTPKYPVGSMPYVLTSDEYEWTEPVNLAEVNCPHSDKVPWVSEDGLTLLFGSRREEMGAPDIWQSTRKKVADEWSEPTNLGALINSEWYDSEPSMSTDGRTLLFVSARPQSGHGRMDLWMATRDSVNEPWSEPVNLGGVFNSDANDNLPYLSDDGTKLVFSSNRSGRYQLYFSTRVSLKAEWSDPQRLTGTSPVLERYSPFDSGCILQNMGVRKVCLSHWDDSKREWVFGDFLGPPINTDGTDCFATFHRATKTLHWQSNRPGGQGDSDLWMAHRVKSIPFPVETSKQNDLAAPARAEKPD